MPTIHWTPLRSGNKATLMIVDLDIENRPSPNLFHYLETNIVGNTVGSGDIQFAFYPPFSFKYEGGNVLIDDPKFDHRFGLLVFEQTEGDVNLGVEPDFCSDVFGRLKVSSELVRPTHGGRRQ